MRIRSSRQEFAAACTDGCIYGEIRGKRGLYVYAELGAEQEYIPSPNDKLFKKRKPMPFRDG